MSNAFTVLYASQTGNGQLIAEEIADSASLFGLKAFLFCTSLVDKRFSFDEIRVLVLISSTTGDGEPPDTAVKLFRRLSRRTLPRDYLNHVNYAFLALGDSTYIKFCQFGKALEERLQYLGAHRFYETGYADDRSNYEETVSDWITNLWPTLRKKLNLFDLVSPEKISSFLPNINILNMLEQSNESKVQNRPQKIILPKDILIQNISSFVETLPQIAFKSPNLPTSYLLISYTDIKPHVENSISENHAHLLANSGILKTKIISARQLTKNDDSVNKALELTLEFLDEKVDFCPGDAFGFLCSNDPEDVEFFLKRLDLSEIADKTCEISLSNSRPLDKRIPIHIPIRSSLRFILSSCVDLRSVPKKVMLKILSEYSTNENDKRTLEFLSSHEGLSAYKECILGQSICILDLLEIFPSCSPPISTLLEHLPHLRPRFYSVASSPLVSNNEFRIVFNVIQIKKYNSQARDGICTGWLNRLSMNIQNNSIESHMSNLSINDKNFPTISVYRRSSNHFHLPDDITLPIIMIGPGTGIAPFIGFLQHREKQILQLKNHNAFGETWLFYGCRYKAKDYLYRNELEALNYNGVLNHLIVCFSRDEDISLSKPPRYVQDNLILRSTELINVLDNGGIIYICGDEKEMSKDVRKTFINIFKNHKGYSEEEAQSYLFKLDREKRYLVDVWT